MSILNVAVLYVIVHTFEIVYQSWTDSNTKGSVKNILAECTCIV